MNAVVSYKCRWDGQCRTMPCLHLPIKSYIVLNRIHMLLWSHFQTRSYFSLETFISLQTDSWIQRYDLSLTLCMLRNCACFLFFDDIVSKLTFKNILLEAPSECQINCIKIRPNILLVLISVQTVCKGYRQEEPCRQIVNDLSLHRL